MASEPIPNYGLYGESDESAADIGIHIEEIAERSRGQNWIIKPHRHGKLFQILCVIGGQASIVRLDDKQHTVSAGTLVSIPVGVVHGLHFEHDCEGLIVTLSDESLSTIQTLQNPDYLQTLFDKAHIIDLNDDPEQIALLRQYLALLQHEFSMSKPARHTSLLMLMNLFLISIKRHLNQHAISNATAPPYIRQVDKFRRLIENHFREHWQVADYAKALNTSTSTLNRMCRQRYNSNAKTIILDRLVNEAKRRLVYTRQPLDQIAYYLGYSDPAYFSRVFKRLTSISPGEYRRAHQL